MLINCVLVFNIRHIQIVGQCSQAEIEKTRSKINRPTSPTSYKLTQTLQYCSGASQT